MLRAPTSIGDAVDRQTILEIKTERIRDPAKLEHVRRERDALRDALRSVTYDPDIYRRLKAVNEGLWDVEDRLRLMEARGEFGDEFVRDARRVYQLNDERAALKRDINIATGSEIVEVKSYSEKNKKIIMIPHMGLGDALILRGMVAHLVNDLGAAEVVFACKRAYAPMLANNLFADLDGKVTLLPVDDDADISPRFGSDGALLREYIARGYEPLLIGLHNPNLNTRRHTAVFAHQFYEDVDMDPALSHTHFSGLRRDAAAEEALYARVVAKHGHEYVVMHQDAARGFHIDRRLLPTNLPVYDVHDPEVTTNNIFEYGLVLERARAVHGMDSCFLLLADRLPGVTCPLICHAYARDNSTLPGLYRKPAMVWYTKENGSYELKQA